MEDPYILLPEGSKSECKRVRDERIRHLEDQDQLVYDPLTVHPPAEYKGRANASEQNDPQH
jgi:hypothetical protein